MSDLPLLGPFTSQDEPATPPARRRPRTRWIVLGVLGVLVIAAAAIFGPTGWAIARQHNTTLRTPATAAGLRHDTGSSAASTAGYLRDALGADISLGSSMGAVYDDPADAQRSVLIFGGTATIVSPGKELDHALSLLDDQTGSVTGLRSVAAGDLGGEMKCGTSNGDGGSMSVCGWADHGSVAVLLFPGRTVDQASDLTRKLRSAIQHRS